MLAITASFNDGKPYDILNTNIGECVNVINYDETHVLPNSKVNKAGDLVIKASVTDSSGNVTTKTTTVKVTE